MINDTIKTKVFSKINECLKIAEKHFDRTFTIDRVRFDIRGRKAGMAIIRGNRAEIRFNAAAFENYAERMINVTVPHEVAHIVQRRVNPLSRPHGNTWKKVMRLFGISDPKTTHTMSLAPATNSGKTVAVRCACMTHHLSMIRYRRLLKGVKYTCRGCRQVLRPATLKPATTPAPAPTPTPAPKMPKARRITTATPRGTKSHPRPAPYTVTGQLWDLFDELKAQGKVNIDSRSYIVVAMARGFHPSTARTQFSKWLNSQ